MKTTPGEPLETFGSKFKDAARFWEPRRIIYNGVLTAVVLAWFLTES